MAASFMVAVVFVVVGVAPVALGEPFLFMSALSQVLVALSLAMHAVRIDAGVAADRVFGMASPILSFSRWSMLLAPCLLLLVARLRLLLSCLLLLWSWLRLIGCGWCFSCLCHGGVFVVAGAFIRVVADVDGVAAVFAMTSAARYALLRLLCRSCRATAVALIMAALAQ
jgi:hypothetical protein